MSRQVLIGQSSVALEAWVGLLRAHASTTRDLSAQLQDDHGLTINDYEALLRLVRAEDQRMRRVDLAGELLLTASGVTRLLDGLERSGYVEKGTCASDARVTYAVLTPAGRAKLREASASHIAQVRALFEEHLADDELRTLADLLSRLPGVGTSNGEECAPE
jgi:DNA-binding MarR family transcriptional regulator